MASFRFSTPCHTEPSPQKVIHKEDNKGRLLKIQQKLQTITIQRHNQVKEDAQELITKKVLQLQTKVTQDMKNMDDQVHSLREQLSQLKVRENQQNKKYQINRKNRKIQIAEVQKKIASLLSYETKERKDKQIGLAQNVEEKTQSISKDLNDLQKKRIAHSNLVEQHLRRELPTTNLAIQSSYTDVETNLENLHREVRVKTAKIRENVEKQDENREIGFKKVMQLLNNVIDEIKKDIQAERKAHQQSKGKLITLFSEATQKLNYK